MPALSSTSLDAPALASASLDALVVLASALPRGLVVLVGDDPWLVESSALWLAEKSGFDEDLRVARPASDRWTIEELDELVIAPSALKPSVRNLIVLCRADNIAPGAYAHLLKTIEEPPAPTTFVFSLRSMASLPATLRGRAAAVCQIQGLDERSHAEALTALGLSAAQAASLVEVTAPFSVWASALASPSSVELALAAFDVPLSRRLPITVATELAEACDAVTAALESSMESPGPTPALLRDVVRHALYRLELKMSISLRHSAVTPAHVARAANVASALERAHLLVDRYAPPLTVFATVLTAATSASSYQEPYSPPRWPTLPVEG